MATTTTTRWPSWSSAIGRSAVLEGFPDQSIQFANQDFGLAKVSGECGLVGQMEKHGNSITQLATSSMTAMESGLDYESLVAGFMTHGETKNADAQLLAFDSVEMWAYAENNNRRKSSSGKALVTNQRLLFLSCNPSNSASMISVGSPVDGGQKGQYVLTYKASNSVRQLGAPWGHLASQNLIAMDVMFSKS
jgi:hypothetical protein